MSLTLKTAPTAEPLDLVTVRGHLRVDSDLEDDRIQNILIPGARQWCESRTNRQLITATYELKLPCFPPSGIIRVPRPPLISTALSITYKDTAGATQTLAAAKYVIDAPSDPWARPGRITLAYGQIWPTTLEEENVVTVTFSCGYGASGSNVPAQLRWAQLLMITEGFENRGQQTIGRLVSKNEVTAQMLCAEFLVESFD
jgi:uncharacterized phiE125 gp8 family phage protein